MNCKKCKSDFTVALEDRKLHEKLGVPAPTLCPECRLKRRLAWRNDRKFYKRKCDKTGKEFVSIYGHEKPYTIYHPDAWYGENWDPMAYGRPFDFKRLFFEQFAELQRAVPRIGIDIVNCQNSYYCNYCGDNKNCYLDIAGEANEDCYFNLFTKYSKDCVDCTFTYHSTLCYETIQAYNAYNLNYSMYCDDTADSSFCFDLKGSRNCLFCSNLRQKEYSIFNQAYSKNEFEKKLKQWDLGYYSKREEALKKWREFRQKNTLYRHSYLLNCENCSGDNLKNCKNTLYSFNATNCEDCKYLYDVLDAKDCQDLNYSLYKPEVAYELISTLNMTYSALSMASHYCHDIFYCEMVNNAGNLFGCVGLRHKEYCILNKQYSKEEYENLTRKIIDHMKKTEEWGEFFPASISPWGYNETVAHEYYPLTKAEAIEQGFIWYENTSERAKQPQTYVIPDHIKNAPDSIINEILVCQNCKKNFKIITQELEYYRKKNIPIPRECPDCRHRDRIQSHSPRKLFDRKCSKCEKTIQSTIAASRPEKVYCEQCYLQEIY